MMLIRTYRVRGHLAADLDPLGLTRRDVPADLTPAYHGFSDADLDRPILHLRRARLRAGDACARSSQVLQATYCGHIGFEYMHINEVEERRFIQDRIEGEDDRQFTPEGKQSILAKVIHAEQWEKFLARKYVGTKRFGLDGGEGAVPALEAVIKYGGLMGVEEIDVGMAHRGRLNILANVMGKPYRRRSSTNSPAARPTPPTSAARATSNTTSALRRTASSTATRCTCRCFPTRRTSKRSTRSCSARRARCRRSRATSTARRCCRSCSTATPPSRARAWCGNA